MSISRRSFLKAAVCGGAAACLAGCNKHTQTSQNELQTLDVVLDFTPNTNHTGLYVAQDQGFYAQENLEINLVQPPQDGADALVGSGKAAFGVSYQDTMANYLGSDTPLPITAIAAIIQHNTSGIMSSAQAQITRPAHMQYKRYGTWGQDVEKAIIKALVEKDHADFSRVELVPNEASDDVAGLRQNQFDCDWTYEAWGLQEAKLQNFETNYFSLRSIDAVFDYYTPVIIANNDFLHEHEQTAKAFLRATKKGYEYACAYPEQAAHILCNRVPALDSKLVEASQKYLANQYQADASMWGIIDKERWANFYTWMNEQHLTQKSLGVAAGFSMNYLQG